MDDLNALIDHAKQNDLEAFEKVLRGVRLQIISIENTSSQRSTEEKTLIFLCGQLRSRPDDLRIFASIWWALSRKKQPLSFSEKDLRSDFATILLAATKNNVLDLARDLKEHLLGVQHHKVIRSPVTNWMAYQHWEGSEQMLHALIEECDLVREDVLSKAISSENAFLVKCLIDGHPQNKEDISASVVGIWAQKTVERKSPEWIQANYAEIHTMFAGAQEHFDMDHLIDLALMARSGVYNPNNPAVNVGAVYQPLVSIFNWDGVSPLSLTATHCRQLDVMVAHMQPPPHSRHEDILRKIVNLCSEDLPHLQEWVNQMERERILQNVESSTVAPKKKL